MLWQRTLQMYGLPATNLLRLEIYGLIARFFDFYFGLDEGKQTPDIRTDLRFEESFFMILQVNIILLFFELFIKSTLVNRVDYEAMTH